MGEAALERAHGNDSKPLLFFFKGYVSGQGQVKGQNVVFPRNLETPHSDYLGPNSAKVLPKVWCMYHIGIAIGPILSKRQGQVTKVTIIRGNI